MFIDNKISLALIVAEYLLKLQFLAPLVVEEVIIRLFKTLIA